MTNNIFVRQDTGNGVYNVWIDEPSNITAPVVTPYLNGTPHPSGSVTAVYDNGRGIWIAAFAHPTITGNPNIVYEINVLGELKKVQHVGSYDSGAGVNGCVSPDLCLEGINISLVCGEGYTVQLSEFPGVVTQPPRFRISSLPSFTNWTNVSWSAGGLQGFGYQYIYDFVVGQTYNIDVELVRDAVTVIKTGSVLIRPNEINCAPITTAVAVNDSGVTGTIGVQQTLNISTNDTPCNNSATTTYVLQGSPSNVNVSIAPSTGIATFTPTGASWSFQYGIYCNGVLSSNVATVSGTAVPACVNPSLVSNTIATQSEVNLPVLGSIVLGGTAPFSLGAILGLPVGVTASLTGNTITLTGNATVISTNNYSITATNCTSGSITVTGSISINAAPSCPLPTVSSNLSVLTGTQTIAYTATIGVTNSTSAVVNNLPSGLSASLAGNTITVSGTPTTTGSFPITVTLTNACGGGSTTTTLTNYPVGTLVISSVTTADAKNDIINVNVNEATTFDLKADNGSGVDVLCSNGETTTFIIEVLPTHGTISGFSSTTGIGTYTPSNNYLGTDGMSYRILCNGVQRDNGIATFNVSSENVEGNIVGDSTGYCNQEYTYTFNQTAGSEISSYTWSVVGGVVKHGNNTNSVLIKWDENVFGNKIITLSVNNPNPFIFTKTVFIVCASANDDVFNATNGQAITINVATNDAVCNSGTTKIMVVTPPTNGHITFQNPFLGVFTYKPNVGFYGKDVFTYKIYCNNIEIDEAVVTINSISTDPCLGKSQEACWVKTDTWKCVGGNKMVMWNNTNLCYMGEKIKWVKDGKCDNCKPICNTNC